ncbi:Dolichol-phosphate mannosyltransferase in lipid-linked oligosaccharide synthesis cluster [Serinicoccus hydrothermalis]|uniref:Dolichol-phosphate mannosyltransferase in lipid-linked oligosaccharide synthesis cluster n=1 Tax=Serinicoccus hydrothermalis TaxID=1758689 RepID=A0A1B1N8K7_9MICO|nr:Dolichol-phosphate mannosyltransferase in lipid-linked oligosaccharide synthesis cluster [Serinicoccus hydrothermalis]
MCVCIPTYQERDSLPGVVRRLRTAVPLADVLVIDDNSPDGTGALAEELGAADPQVRVLHRQAKEGLGPAYLAGFAWAADHGYDAVVEMDADGSHRPEELPALLAAAGDGEGADLVIGSRWVDGGSVHRWPLHRKGLSVGANTYVRLALGIPVRDATAGFRVYRLPQLASLLATPVASQGYCFQVDLTLRAVDAGLTVREVPIAFVERAEGASKMTDAIVREAVVRVGRWAWERRTRQVREHLVRRDRSRWHHLEEAT